MSEMNDTLDGDLLSLTHSELVHEVVRLRAGIRRHRDSTGHDLCWHQPALWGMLPEASDAVPEVPAWPEFMRGCVHYRQSLDLQLPPEQHPRLQVEYTPPDEGP